MWRPRIPDEKVTWLGADFLPLAAFLFEPLHSVFGEAVPLRSPSWNSLLVDKLFVEFLGQKMAASADNQSTVICSIWQQVHKTLQTPESWLRWVLILMRPWRIWRNVFAAGNSMLVLDRIQVLWDLLWKTEVDSIERYDEILGVIDLLKGTDYAWLTSNCPSEILVSDGILQAHALLIDPWEVVFVDSREIIPVKAKVAEEVCQLEKQSSFSRRALTIPPANCTSHRRTCPPVHEEWLL